MSDLSKKYVHRLNQRLLSFEKMGLTNSRSYRFIVEQTKLLGAGTKGGKNRISESFDDISQLQRLLKVASARETMTKTRRQLQKEIGRKPTDDEIKAHINQTGSLESWIDENLGSIYELSKFMNEAQALFDMINAGLRKFDYNAIWSRIHDFENARDEFYKENPYMKTHGEFTRFTERFDENDTFREV